MLTVWRSGILGRILWIPMLTLTVFTTMACQQDNPVEGEDSHLNGLGSATLRRIFLPRPLTAAEISRFFLGFKSNMGRVSAAGIKNSEKENFKGVLARTLVDVPNIPPDQLYQAIRSTLENSEACDGVPCGRIFGIDTAEINATLDDLEHKIATNPELQKPEKRSVQAKLLASLHRVDIKNIWNNAKVRFSRDGKNGASLEGTCVIPALQAFGLRSNPPSPGLSSGFQGPSKNIDYRNNLSKPSQLSTGACHLFATVETFKHSKLSGLDKVKEIDIPYTFAEMWSKNLGQNVDDAIVKELKFMDDLELAHLSYMNEIFARGGIGDTFVSLEKGFSKAVENFSVHTRFSGQGNNALVDYLYLANEGAVSTGHGLPPISMDQVEKIGEKLALARLRILEERLLKKNSLSVEQKKAFLEGPIRELFAISARSKSADRGAIKKELTAYKLRTRPFNILKRQEQITGFFADLRDHGPLHINANSHSTVVVGYNARNKMFYIRDSDDPLNRPYTEVHQEEIFSNIRDYYFLETKKPRS
jgi:hypothetical protein